jgi:hypothetical protein
MRILTNSGFDAVADRPWAGLRYGRIVPKGMIGSVVPAATQAEVEGVP